MDGLCGALPVIGSGYVDDSRRLKAGAELCRLITPKPTLMMALTGAQAGTKVEAKLPIYWNLGCLIQLVMMLTASCSIPTYP